MKRMSYWITLQLLMAGAFASAASAEFTLGTWDLSAGAGLGAQLTNIRKSSAKWVEYRDFRNSALANAYLNAERATYRLNLEATRIGLDDQEYVLSGGRYGSFQYDIFYNSIIHNLSFNALTLYSNPGSDSLNWGADVSPTIPTTWPSRFDYTVKQKNFGANASYYSEGPIFYSIGVEQSKPGGIRPVGVSLTTPGGPGLELPEPIDQKNNTVAMEIGYKEANWTTSLDGSFSRFTNFVPFVEFRNPSFAATTPTEKLSVPPSNDYWKIGGKAAWNPTGLNSSFLVRATYAKLTNEQNLFETIADGNGNTGDPVAVPALTRTFTGDLQYGTASAALTSEPVQDLETKLYYNFSRKWNQNTAITFTGATPDENVTNELFSYYKHDLGVDVDYPLPAKTKLGLGYEYMNVHRHRIDAIATRDHIYYAELRNNQADFVSAKVKYQRLNRSSDAGYTEGGLEGDFRIFYYLRRFDATNKGQDKVSAALDFALMDNVGLGLEYTYRMNDYYQTIFGRNKDRSNEIYADLSYQVPSFGTFILFADYELTKYESSARRYNPGIDPSPLTPPDANNYNWGAGIENRTWGWGVEAEVPVIENKVDFGAGWQQYRGKGNTEFGVQSVGVAPAYAAAPIGIFDNYIRNTLRAKARYAFTENFSATLGYLYELFKYEDISFDAYTLVPGTDTLTGAFSDHDYTGHLGYLVAEVRF
ncbi:MAG TPA: MtrB/PioB family outer membrane beta-barrel protein [Bdellovibrionota bacterium]|nr:MtrB/PioB family outer membrane beta-barrel protein [Bdellovibrionota bacterium]